MVHLLSQLDPMVWLMMVVVAIGFAVAAAVLVELLPEARRREPDGGARHEPAGEPVAGTPPTVAAGGLPAKAAPTGSKAPVRQR